MVTDMLRKQMQAEVERVYSNMPSFIDYFSTAEELQWFKEDLVSYYIAFTHDGIYVQKHWVDEDDQDCQIECEYSYIDYNDWCKELKASEEA